MGDRNRELGIRSWKLGDTKNNFYTYSKIHGCDPGIFTTEREETAFVDTEVVKSRLKLRIGNKCKNYF